MKVWIKNVKGEHFPITLNPKNNMKIMKEKIQTFGIGKSVQLTMFYNSDAIQQRDTVESLGICPFDVITVFGHPHLYVKFNLDQQPNSFEEAEKIEKSQYNPSDLVTLASLGFSPQIGREALIKAKGNLHNAISLLNNKKNKVITLQERLLGVGFQNIDIQEGFQEEKAQLIKDCSNLLEKVDPMSVADNQAIQRMVQMGFSKNLVIHKYQQNNKNYAETVNHLLNDSELSVSSNQQFLI